MLDKIAGFDRNLFLIINNSLESRFNDFLFGGLTIAGDLLFLLPLALAYLYIVDKNNFKRNSVILILAVILGGLIVRIIKEFAGRPRPLKDMEPLIAAGKVHIHNILGAYRENSFPSGHTQAAFGTATALICILRKHIPYLIIIACLMGLSRIYVGVHFPLDVFFGAITGILISLTVYGVAMRILNKDSKENQKI